MANFGAVSVGGEPTFVEVDAAANRVFTVSHAENKLVVINGAINVIERTQPTGGDGAFGLAVNTKLKRAYVSHRRSGDIATMDGTNGWQSIENQRINACGAGREPYALAFNPINDRLYVACATNDNVDTAVVYRAEASGLTRLVTLPLQAGGSDGGGGIAVNPLTGNVFFTNSEAGAVTTINGSDQLAGPATPVGLDPFGIAADPSRGFVYVGLRLGNNVVVLKDSAPPPGTAPKIFLSRQDGCEGVPITVTGANFSPSLSGRVELRVDGVVVTTASVDASGNFSVVITLPGPKAPGGIRTITAYDPALPARSASATLRTPRTDLPVIFMGGIAGSRLAARPGFIYEIPPWDWWGNGEKREYKLEEEIWLGTRSIDQALFGNDYHFYPLRLTPNGLDPYPDPDGRVASVYPSQPVWALEPPLGQPVVDVYIGLYARMHAALAAQGRRVYDFAYDWRKVLDVTDPLLDQKIDAVLQETGKDKVILVGHSMGGMLSRNYVLKHGASKVDQIITFGTPYLGSVNPAKYLEMGDNMGMQADILGVHNELNPEVVKEMALNFGGLYQMLPARLWFNRSPFDGAYYDPRYLGMAGWMLKEGLFGDIWTAKDVSLQSYDQTKSYLARNYNSNLVDQGDRFTATGIGDLTLMTDQYINQRIIGVGTPTWGHLWVCERPCRVCTKNWWDNGYTCNNSDDVPAIPILDTLGDDTVPLRSGAAYEPISKMEADGHYYFVDNAHHMTLGADTRVQDLVTGLLRGDFCTIQQVQPSGNANAATGSATGLTTDAPEADYAALGTTTGVQLTLIGDAEMTIADAQGRRLTPTNGLLAGYANTIPGANLVDVGGAQVAALTTGGPFTVTIRGTAADGMARLIVSNLQSGAIVRTLTFPGLPMTTTTTAVSVLPGPVAEQDLALTFRYTPDSPEQLLTGILLDGSQAGDTQPPSVKVTLDRANGLVSVTADDGADGAGVMQVLYSGESSPTHFLPYVEPFAWPAGAQCVTGLAQDRAGNTGAGRLCRTWLPMLIK
jgi:DNA-binding beta-propeller fold protein YncE/pimeloyl-ACP methyl ester carboxylesterase